MCSDQKTAEFYDLLASNFLLPTILIPTKINKKSDTLIDNIFTNHYNPDTVSGNLTVSISDHLPSFAIFPNSKMKHVPKRHNIYKRDFSNLKEDDYANIKNEFNEIDWDKLLQYEKNDADFSFNIFFQTLEKIIDKYFPHKKQRI